jgi:hypothetical protein
VYFLCRYTSQAFVIIEACAFKLPLQGIIVFENLLELYIIIVCEALYLCVSMALGILPGIRDRCDCCPNCMEDR